MAKDPPWVQRFMKSSYKLGPKSDLWSRSNVANDRKLISIGESTLEDLILRLAILLAIMMAHRKQTKEERFVGFKVCGRSSRR